MNIGLNPYEFLGLTPSSSLDELRKAYHDMSLLMHPDKGGSAQEMHILITAYKWIKEQLEHKSDKNYETIQLEFDEFIQKQNNEKPPPLTHILAETIGFEYNKFKNLYNTTLLEYKLHEDKHFTMINNLDFMYSFIYFSINSKYIKNNQYTVSSNEIWNYVKNELKFYCTSNSPLDYEAKIPASIPHGYENEMEKSTYTDEYKETLKFLYNGLSNECSNLMKECTRFKKDIIKYIEPKAITEFKQIGIPLQIPIKLEDYSIYEPIQMTDYKEAFSIGSNIILDIECNKDISTPINELMKKYEKDRQTLNIV